MELCTLDLVEIVYASNVKTYETNYCVLYHNNYFFQEKKSSLLSGSKLKNNFKIPMIHFEIQWKPK